MGAEHPTPRPPLSNKMTIFNPDDRYLGWRPEGPRRSLPKLELRKVKDGAKVICGLNPRPTTFDGSDKLATINGHARSQPAPAPVPSKRRAKRLQQPTMLVNVRFAPASLLELQIQLSSHENNPK
jgi:hypothetical protein